MPNRFQRHIGSMSYPAGGAGVESVLQLPRTALSRKLTVQLRNTITVTTGGGTVLAEGVSSLLRSIEVRANGSDTIKRYDGGALRQLNHFDFGQLAPEEELASAATDEISTGWTIPFNMPRSIRPIDTILDNTGFSLLELVLIWGDENDALSSPTGTWDFSDLIVDVQLDELEGVAAANGFGLFLESSHLNQFSAQTGVQEIRLPAAEFYRGITIKCHTTNLPGTPLDTIIEQVSLRSGNTNFLRNVGWGDENAATQFRGGMLVENQAEYGIDVPVGYRRIDFAPEGMLGGSLAVDRLEELILEADLGSSSTTGDVRTYTHRIKNPQKRG